MKLIFSLTLIIISLIKFSTNTKFFFTLTGKAMKCMGEYLTENTVGI